MDYDVIGDVHGQAGKLEALLKKLGYRVKDGAYRHPEGRMAAFLGDLIDRGPEQVKVVNIVRDMIEAGSGRTIMGNHEWNAYGCGTLDPEGSLHLRPRIESKMKDHLEFLRQVGLDSPLHKELVAWFGTLPPVLDLGGIRLCHAWWRPESVETVVAAMDDDGKLGETFLTGSFRKKTAPWLAMDNVVKGYEVSLPGGEQFLDHNDVPRKDVRVRWWDATATTFRSATLVPECERNRIPDTALPKDVKLGAASTIPTFVGHYWLTGKPGIQNATTAVLDYGAAIRGPLVAYRWEGEPALTNENLVWINPGEC